MKIGLTGRAWALTAALLLAGCGGDATPIAPDPGDALHAKGGVKGGNGGNGGKDGDGGDGGGESTVLVADVVGVDASDITSTCPGEVTDNHGILFRHTDCLIIPLDDYALTDDITFSVKSRKGQIIEMVLTGQDVIGGDGIMHETDNLLDAPVTTNPDGFTVHIRKAVEVWRLSGHLRGKRQNVAGVVYIGDVVYRPEDSGA